jgi:signal transduction histidine kinase
MKKEEYFKISSGLKDLIGGQLITDKFAAVFELVKNSFDASASEVKIKFENIYGDDSKIIISDNGKGMDYSDIKEKWLFVAYSAKKDGTEDSEADYRKNLKSNRHYAGAKGVGRFSCDRLGRVLNLYSVKKTDTSKIEHIKVDWREFEKNQKIEFGKIPVERNNPSKTPYHIRYGTILEISEIVKEDWDRKALLDLKDKLSKLIRPKLSDRVNENRQFKIILEAKEELDADDEAIKKFRKEGAGKIYKETVNGEIKNFIFDELDIRTTKIVTEIINDGKEIKTTLIDRNTEIYSITEKNNFNYLYNVSVSLYFLNQASKAIFSRKIGEQPINYGNVFVYKNGFRIYPFGEPRDDSMGIDARGTQGYARYLQTRNLIGQIEVYQEKDQLIESTSRDGGFIKNKAFNQLKDFFFEKSLKRLEKYVVEVAEWGVDDESLRELSEDKIKQNLVKFISNISAEDTITELSYNDRIIKLVDAQEEKSAKRIIKNFKRIAAESNNPRLLSAAKKLEKKFEEYKGLNKENVTLADLKEKAEKELEKKKEQLSIATSIASQDLDNVTNLHHQVRVITDVIKTELLLFSRKIDKGEKISTQDLKDFLDKISYENSKIESISKFGTRAIFENFTDISKADLAGFVENYVKKISNYFSASKTRVSFHSNLKEPFEIKFRPLDISIIIDNMISNSKKADASSLSIELQPVSSKEILMIFKDNGKGLSKEIKNVDTIFEKGFSTTRSTGLGLYHVKNIVSENKWEIKANTKIQKGIEFILTIRK